MCGQRIYLIHKFELDYNFEDHVTYKHQKIHLLPAKKNTSYKILKTITQ